jgi:hypothetical protein
MHPALSLAPTRHQLVLHVTPTNTTLKGAESYSDGQEIICSYGTVFRNACNLAPTCVSQITQLQYGLFNDEANTANPCLLTVNSMKMEN